jgi:hypothetical protein
MIGRGTADQFRIKITNTATGAVVYDNLRGQSDAIGNSQTLDQGSISIKT